MKKINLLLFLVLLLSTCKSDEEELTPTTGNNSGGNPSPDFEVSTIIPNGDEAYLTENSDYIFDQEKIHTFELNIPLSDYEKINGDPAAEEYVEGNLIFEGDTISPVGIRYKGSIGAYVGCLSGGDWANPSGHKTCTKLSMKIKINWEGREERFYGLKKLQFHSMNNDKSQMRERLGYWFFREMNVPAPRCVHARLKINGVFIGVFALVEQIDGRFLRYNFEDGNGNLYKEIWPLHSNGQPFPESEYLDHLKTNEDEDPSASLIRTFAQAIAEAEEEERKSIVEEWMDMGEVISYAAVDRTIRNDDGAFHWYCNGSTCSPHNFYWYEEPSAETLHLIPWDLDHAFENIISNVNPVTPVANDWGETSSDCEPFSYGSFGLKQRSAACDKLIGTWASYTDEYNEKLTIFKNGPLSIGNANVMLDKWEALIRGSLEEAENAHGDAISISSWETEMERLKEKLEFARNN
jgi:hypothetical protein